MNTRRIPFQFSTTDPLARQRELERRFGLQSTCPKMYVDVNNPLSMGTTPKEISSPRLQHRVPIFAEGYDHPIHSSSVDSMASIPENKKPNVRVIPIEVEGADRSPRHRTYSGPADTLKDRCDTLASERNGAPPFKRFNFEGFDKTPKPKLNTEPKVFNIPIQVEGANKVSRSPKSTINKIDTSQKTKSTISPNGCSQSKTASKVKSPNKSEASSEPTLSQADQSKNAVEILLKKIEDVLNEFKTYETGVSEFSGTSKDKQYRYLDEMLTRCMLRLDDIDTMGNEEVRLARKSAVKKIQASIDLLESKANVKAVTSTEVSEMQVVPDKKNVDNEVDMKDKSDDYVAPADSAVCFEMDAIGNDKVSDSNRNESGTKTESEIESVKTEGISNNVTDIEMCETTNVDGNFESKSLNITEVSCKTEDIVQDQETSTSSLPQQNNIPEIEMSEETSLDKINSINNAQSPELLSTDNKCVEQNNISNETVTDVEMLEEKDLSSSLVEGKESLNDEFAVNKSHLSKSNEIAEVEMEDLSSKETEKKENSTTVDQKSDCFEEKTGDVNINVQVTSNLPSEDAEINNSVHGTVNDCLTELSGQEITSETSQSEKDKTLKD